MGRLSKSNYLLYILFWCHTVTTNKIQPREINYSYCDYVQLHFWFLLGQVRVLLVAINVHFPSSLKIRTKESRLHPSTTKTMVVYKCTLRLKPSCGRFPILNYLRCLQMQVMETTNSDRKVVKIFFEIQNLRLFSF